MHVSWNLFLLINHRLNWSFTKPARIIWAKTCEHNLKVMGCRNLSTVVIWTLSCESWCVRGEKAQLVLHSYRLDLQDRWRSTNCCELHKGNVESLSEDAYGFIQLLSTCLNAKVYSAAHVFSFLLSSSQTFPLSSSNSDTWLTHRNWNPVVSACHPHFPSSSLIWQGVQISSWVFITVSVKAWGHWQYLNLSLIHR